MRVKKDLSRWGVALGWILPGVLWGPSAWSATTPLLPFGFDAKDWEVQLGSSADPGIQLIPNAINVKVSPQKLGSKLFVYVGVRNENKASAWARVDLPLGTSEGEFSANAAFAGGETRTTSFQLRFAGGKVRGAIESSCESQGLGLATPQAPSAGDYVFLRCKPTSGGAVQVEVASLVSGGQITSARWTDPLGTQDFGEVQASESSADGYGILKVDAPGIDSGRREVEFSLGSNTYRLRKQAPQKGATASTKGITTTTASKGSGKGAGQGDGLSIARFVVGNMAAVFNSLDATGTLVQQSLQATAEIGFVPRYRFGLSSSLKLDVGLEASASLININSVYTPGFQYGGNLGLAFAGGKIPLLLEAGKTHWSKDGFEPSLAYVGSQVGYENPKGIFGLSFWKGLRLAAEKNLGSTEFQRTWQFRIGAIIGW